MGLGINMPWEFPIFRIATCIEFSEEIYQPSSKH
jgi:hypothetical protein